jgi:hypothetical protein
MHMNRSDLRTSSWLYPLALASALTGCAPVTETRVLPEALRPSSTEVLAFEARATGVQIYQCASAPAATSRPAWAFKAPEADLYDREGRRIGRHYAGPTWEAVDGSKVVGVVSGKQDAPVAAAIPWLLLTASSNAGTGRFAATSSIQRLDTAGGSTPADACSQTNLGALRRVPYTATYYFYRVAGVSNEREQ